MIPSHCKIVIIGGGIIGSSTAYHLAQLGETDTVLLEQGELTNGSTWHAAGLVGQLRSSANITQLLKYSIELYAQLGDETGQETGWKMNGGLRLACQDERVREIKRQITMAHSFGLEMHYLSPSEAAKLCPILDTSDLLGAAYLPTDGQANPSDLTRSLIKGARANGIRCIEHCRVDAITTKNQAVTSVKTSQGTIQCEIVVNCAGLWSRAIGALAGVNVPIVPMKHHYIVTGLIDGVTADMPTIRDPDRLIYFKEDVGGLVFGGYEPNPKDWPVDHPGDNFGFTLLDFDVDHFEPLMQAGLNRVPAMEKASIKEMICGPESFTPDGNFILGEAPEVRNYFVGTGFNAFGIASGGGAGKALAEWIASSAPPMDLGAVDIRRFGRVHQDRDWITRRTIELCSKHYTMAWPGEEHDSGRPYFQSALYGDLKAANAVFGEKLGWERPNWYAPQGQDARDIYSFGRPNWFDAVGVEHRAIRESVGMIDQSSFAKFILRGADALELLNLLCSNRMDRPVGSVVYTTMLNGAGGIECDTTVTRLAEDEFFIVAGTGYATHHFHHIVYHKPNHLNDLSLSDVTRDYSTLSISGPRSRDLLQPLLDLPLDNETFRFLKARPVKFGELDAWALRVSFAGELGWELHIPVANTVEIFRRINHQGKHFGLKNVGYRALETLRLEKGFLALGSDIGPDYTPLEAGMEKLVRLDSDIEFIGQKALLEQQRQPLKRRLACFTNNDENITLHGRETIYRNGERVGWTSSAGWGYTVGANVAYGYVRNPDGVSDAYLFSGDYELEVEHTRIPVQIQKNLLYDATSARMRS